MRFEGEHVFEAFHHSTIIRLPRSTLVPKIKFGKYIATRIGLSRKLDEEGGKQFVKVSFISVPEVEIKVGHGGIPSDAQGLNILYDRGTKSMSVSRGRDKSKKGKPDDTFP